MSGLSDIVEGREVGMNRANKLLAKGYVLLAVDFVGFEANRRKVTPGGGETFVRHDVRWVIGRTAEMPPFPSFDELDAEERA